MKTLIALGIVSLSLMSTAVMAEKMSIGASLGKANYSFDTTVDELFSISNDHDDKTYSLFGTYRMQNGLIIRLAHNDLGEFRTSFTRLVEPLSSEPNPSVSFDISGVSLSIINEFTITKRTRFFAELGKLKWKLNSNIESVTLENGVSTTNITTSKAEGSDTYYGYGLSRQFSKTVFGALSSTRFKIENETVKVMAISLRITG